ncbi:type II toxin-antitoxin system RelE/ParE family toxin [uncultured Thiodictyon sp.]|jgi:plasmid stabilization system protein ParE|uniref:type II toxin-antitoxin system RelE/ParE family toxin n=1 Tax=uncultured Thiodictyon sp. TaxID=1846217 RepID=UPI0025DFFF16|nr:type II toxin-antitoxin system RelE/ParE family toxin [uncultured Thiodictyon sp.]
MIVSVHREADAELLAGAVYYAQHGGRTVAEAFLDEFDYAVSLLREFPQLGAPWRGRARKFPLRRFPYSLIYYATGTRLRIVAVAHQSRKPGYWNGRF